MTWSRDLVRHRRPGAVSAALVAACAALLAGAGPAAARGVPIVLYHHVSAAPAGAASPSLWVPPRRFRRQIRGLARAGYHGVTLGQVWRHWHEGAPLPAKPVVVSFDDGYASQHAHALPVLRRHGWPGVLNLEWRRLGARGGLSRAQVQEMIDAGWEIGDHTLTHPDLTKVGPARLRREVAGSRARMQRRLGVPVDFFCYPYGHVDATVEAAVRDAGFLAATTTRRGLTAPGRDPFALGRLIVTARTSPAQLRRLARRGR
ncbi:MAG TPA: polysaccharide deacetylase family protein [Baekduia sp.]|nr:polysaccharide deacetylase family protein [Baekduia sp.]